MTALVKQFDRTEVAILLESSRVFLDADQETKLDRCLMFSDVLHAGFVDSALVCLWGLIPPTLLSDRAYIWLYTTPQMKDHEFVFVRNSQRVIKLMLESHPAIYGHVHADNRQGLRWIKWLGAQFQEPDGKLIPFVIRKKSDG